MAKSKRRRLSSEDGSGGDPTGYGTGSDLPQPIRFISDFFRPGRGEATPALDFLDYAVYFGIAFVTLVVPFLYSRGTTENFLTPKEFTAKIALAIFGAVFCIRFILEDRIKLAKTSLDLPLFLFFGFSLLSVMWNYNIPSALRDLRGTFLIMMLFPLIVNCVRSRWQLEGILWLMVFAGIATSTLGIMESYNIYYRFDRAVGWVFARDEIFAGQIDYTATYIPLFPQLASKDYSMMGIVSTFGNRNYLGTFAMFCAFIPAAFLFYYRNLFMKGFSFMMFFWMCLGLMVTRCRAALLGIPFGIAYMVIMLLMFDRSWKFVKRNAPIFIGLLLLLALGFGIAVTTSKNFDILDKIKTTFTMDRTKSNVYERIWVWYATFRNFAPNPFKWMVGSGYGSYKHFFPLQEAETFDNENKETFTPVTFRQAHNDWLQLVSELGLIGFALFIFLVWRFFGSIYKAIRDDTRDLAYGEFTGDHVLLLGMGAAMVAQMIAAGPDFPFHRIETALYAVIVLGLVPAFAETRFFKKMLDTPSLVTAPGVAPIIAGTALLGGLLAVGFEWRTWSADVLVRTAETVMAQRLDAGSVDQAKKMLQRAINLDPLPGDPYLKVSTILEMEGKGEEALAWAEKAWKNINFNARSTYHSVVFRKMHVYYHILRDREKAYEQAKEGHRLTCGDARSIYYFYLGKIAMELGKLAEAEDALRHAVNYPAFVSQAGANLAVVLASQQKWAEAMGVAASVSQQISNTDPTILDILGLSAFNLNQLATAETALRKALELSPGQPVYKRDLGLVLLKSNKVAEAKKFLEEAWESVDCPAQVKVEVQTTLASVAVFQRDYGLGLIKQGNREPGLAALKEAWSGKAVPPEMKNSLQALIATFGGFQAERGPLPAELPLQPNPQLPSASGSQPVVPPPALAPAPAPTPSPTPAPTTAPAPSPALGSSEPQPVQGFQSPASSQ